MYTSKIEKVPRGIRGEKSSKDMASSRNAKQLVSTIGALASPKMGTEPGVRKGTQLIFFILAKYEKDLMKNDREIAERSWLGKNFIIFSVT